MRLLLSILFACFIGTSLAKEPKPYYYSDGSYFSSASEACAAWTAKYPLWTFSRVDKGPGLTHYCMGEYKNDNPKRVRLFNIVSEMLLCDDKGTHPIGGQCPEICPDGSVKQPGKECPKKCPDIFGQGLKQTHPRKNTDVIAARHSMALAPLVNRRPAANSSYSALKPQQGQRPAIGFIKNVPVSQAGGGSTGQRPPCGLLVFEGLHQFLR